MSFVNLTIPSSGPGAASDTSAIGSEKTFTFSGPSGPANKALVLEGSNDGGATFSPVLQITQYNNQGTVTFHGTFQQMRLNLVAGSPPTSASVGGENQTTSFLTLDSTGVDSSALGSDATFTVAGQWQGTVVVEGSNDGTNYDPSPVVFFNTGFSDVKNFAGTYKKLRARLLGIGTFSVSVGTSTPSGTATSGGAQICLDAYVEDYDQQAQHSSYALLDNGVDKVIAYWVVDFDRLTQTNVKIDLSFFASQNGPASVFVTVGAAAPTTPGGNTVLTVPVTVLPGVQGIPPVIAPRLGLYVGRQVVQVVMNSSEGTRVEAIFLTFEDAA